MTMDRVVRITAGALLAVTGVGGAALRAHPAAVGEQASAPAGWALTTSWFHDPVSASSREAEMAVPADPGGYRGASRQTKATFRTHAGALAVPISWATGHTLASGQAVALTSQSLFAFNSATLTATAVIELRRLGPALDHVRAVTCEGDTDFGGLAAHEQSLSVARAVAVCALVHANRHDVAVTSVGYGGTDPVIVGGAADDRAQNRRVDIVVTGVAGPVAPKLLAARPGASMATITFSKPSYSGGKSITGYRVSINGGKTWKPVATAGRGPYTLILTGLTDGVTYPVAVRAASTGGHGPASNRLHVTPRSGVVPLGPPTLTAAIAGDTTATVTFTAPASDGGHVISGYQVSTDGGTVWSPVTTSGAGPYSAVLAGLSDGTTYPVTVRAVTAAGDTAASNRLDVTPLGVPSPPAITDGTAEFETFPGPNYADLSFTPPATDNGSPVTTYLIAEDGGSYQPAVYTLGSPDTILFPVPYCAAKGYTFSIEAVNAVGPSLPSSPYTLPFGNGC
jgi:outer membrane protein OmpA-like peptidoglycan-associated protein